MKKILTIALAAIMLFAFAACGGGDGGDSLPDIPNPFKNINYAKVEDEGEKTELFEKISEGADKWQSYKGVHSVNGSNGAYDSYLESPHEVEIYVDNSGDSFLSGCVIKAVVGSEKASQYVKDGIYYVNHDGSKWQNPPRGDDYDWSDVGFGLKDTVFWHFDNHDFLEMDFYVSDDVKNIKMVWVVEYKEEEHNSIWTYTVQFRFDDEDLLIAVRYDENNNTVLSEKITAFFEPWTGTIKFPSDLDSYPLNNGKNKGE